MLQKQLDAVNIKLDLLNSKVNTQTQILQQELNKLNEHFIQNPPVNEPIAQKYGTCTLL